MDYFIGIGLENIEYRVHDIFYGFLLIYINYRIFFHKKGIQYYIDYYEKLPKSFWYNVYPIVYFFLPMFVLGVVAYLARHYPLH